MKKHNFFVLFFLLFSLLSFFPHLCWSQLVLGQYEDEAPHRTWNMLGITTASSLGLGETHFAFATDCSVSLVNPALLSMLPKITFTLNSSYNLASFFKYSLVNTGVLSSDKNLASGLYAIDFGGFSVRTKAWGFSVSHALLETYDRPSANAEYHFQGILYYTLDLNQEGLLKNINFAVSRKLHRRLSFGIGLNYVYGNIKKDINEHMVETDITITDSKAHEFQGFYLNGGLVLELSDKLRVAAIFRTPYEKKSDSESSLRYNSPHGNIEIEIEASSKNTYKQPLVVGLGISYEFSPELRVASDFAFFNWSKYKVNYFQEELERNFKDIIKIGAGFEYLSSIRIFNQDITIPLRAGLSYDPQPMREPSSSYLYFSFGTGLRWGKIFLDAGIFIGSERGSGDSLSAKKFALSVSYLY